MLENETNKDFQKFIDSMWLKTTGKNLNEFGDMFIKLSGVIDLDQRTSKVLLDMILDKVQHAAKEDMCYQTSSICAQARTEYLEVLSNINEAVNCYLKGDIPRGKEIFNSITVDSSRLENIFLDIIKKYGK